MNKEIELNGGLTNSALKIESTEMPTTLMEGELWLKPHTNLFEQAGLTAPC